MRQVARKKLDFWPKLGETPTNGSPGGIAVAPPRLVVSHRNGQSPRLGPIGLGGARKADPRIGLFSIGEATRTHFRGARWVQKPCDRSLADCCWNAGAGFRSLKRFRKGPRQRRLAALHLGPCLRRFSRSSHNCDAFERDLFEAIPLSRVRGRPDVWVGFVWVGSRRHPGRGG